MVLLITFVLMFCVLSCPAAGGQIQFVEQWKKYDEQIQVSYDLGQFLDKKIRKQFAFLREYRGVLAPPPESEGKIGKAFVLYEQENFTILLVTPENVMRSIVMLNREYRQARTKCEEDDSWLVVLPENTWTETALNPYCAMDYDEEDITFDLYWTGSAARPLIDIITDGLTCVPHHLYRWDRVARGYTAAAFKCSGLRTVEGYSGTGMRFEQLY